MKDDASVMTPEQLLRAYMMGVFPMAEHRDDDEIFFVDPHHRGVLPMGRFRISRSLSRRMRQARYQVSLNRDFAGVLEGCAARSETWISEKIRKLYSALHNTGHAHSFEVWQDGELSGGVYGVALGAAFFGESMFSHRTDASKLALVHLCDHLRRCGYVLFDTQFITPHLASLGGIEISRDAYHTQLSAALSQSASVSAVSLSLAPGGVLQRMTQTS